MDYPPNLPPEAQNRVEAAKIRAGRKFDRDKAKASSAREIQLSLMHYIMLVFGVFVREAKLRRLWHASEMKSACLDFLRQLTIEAYFEKGYDHAGRSLPPMTSHVDGSILPKFLKAFRSWPAWRQFEAALLAVATSPARRVEAQPSPEREQPQEEPARVSPAAAPGPARESIQVTSSAAVFVVQESARRARKRKRKPARTRVQESAPAPPAETTADKAATESESVIEATQPVEPAQEAGPISAAKGRFADVQNFIEKMKDAGYTIKRVDITIVASRHKDPRSLQHFQYNIAKASPVAIVDYDRVLRMAPADFMAILAQRRTAIEASRKPKRKARR